MGIKKIVDTKKFTILNGKVRATKFVTLAEIYLEMNISYHIAQKMVWELFGKENIPRRNLSPTQANQIIDGLYEYK